MSQNKRDEAMRGFRQQKFDVLVATDIAARGIDVAKVSHVINYDVPTTVDAYTHRIGRTGRAELTGKAYTFATPEDRAQIWAIEKRIGSPIVRLDRDGTILPAEEPPRGAAKRQRSAPQGQRAPRSGSGRPRRGNGQGRRSGQPAAQQTSGNSGQNRSRSAASSDGQERTQQRAAGDGGTQPARRRRRKPQAAPGQPGSGARSRAAS